jgi:D-alanyl-lipoteichoic acid acyltransferase DltB (MBOAT superfamily)
VLSELLLGLFISGVTGAVVRITRRLSVTDYLWLIHVIAAICFFQTRIFGLFVTHWIVFIGLRGLAHINNEQSRWHFASVGMLSLGGVFLAGRHLSWSHYTVRLFDLDWSVFELNMWMCLQILTICWEVGSGRVHSPALRNYVAWALLPLAYQGPLLRYSQFEYQSNLETTPSKSVIACLVSLDFFIATLVLVLGLSAGFSQEHLVAIGKDTTWWGRLLSWFLLGPWGFYLTLAGFYRLMEVLAGCWGMQLPASFNYPFGRRNISEFWANWNMTATAVFRDYFFYNRWGLKQVNVYLNTLILFFLVGLWHGSNGYWIIFGVTHGIGFCAFLWFKKWHARIPFVASITSLGSWQFASAVLTYMFVCSCWVLPPQLLKLLWQ